MLAVAPWGFSSPVTVEKTIALLSQEDVGTCLEQRLLLSKCELLVERSRFAPHFLGLRGFPHSSVGKESTCNAGDPSLIPGWEKFTGEGIGYPLQYSWASLVAQLVKNPPAIRETLV